MTDAALRYLKCCLNTPNGFGKPSTIIHHLATYEDTSWVVPRRHRRQPRERRLIKSDTGKSLRQSQNSTNNNVRGHQCANEPLCRARDSAIAVAPVAGAAADPPGVGAVGPEAGASCAHQMNQASHMMLTCFGIVREKPR